MAEQVRTDRAAPENGASPPVDGHGPAPDGDNLPIDSRSPAPDGDNLPIDGAGPRPGGDSPPADSPQADGPAPDGYGPRPGGPRPGGPVRAGARWRIRLRRLLLAALALFAIVAAVHSRETLADALREVSGWAVLCSVLPAVLAMVAGLAVWRTLLADLGARLPWRAALRIFFISQLGKYVPGTVWSIVTQIELSREHRVPRRTNVTVGVLAIAVSIMVGLSLAALMLPLVAPWAARRYWWALLIIPVFAAALHPGMLSRLLGTALRLLRREPLPRRPGWPGLATAAGYQALVWVFFGLHLWLLLIGVHAPVLSSLPVAIAGYALAYSLGQLAVALPAGAGVRDAALAVVLSTLVDPPLALTLALVSRAVLTGVDLALAGGQYLVSRPSLAREADR